MLVAESNLASVSQQDQNNCEYEQASLRFLYALTNPTVVLHQSTLANVFQGKAIIIPRSIDDGEAYRISETLKDQLIGFRRRTSDKTGAEAIQSTAPHDDMAISLAMAIQEGTRHESMELLPVW